MGTLTEVFGSCLGPLFPFGAEIVDNDNRKIRVIYPITETTPGRRYSRPVVLNFDEAVVEKVSRVVQSRDSARLKEIQDALSRLAKSGLRDYDERGDQLTAHMIHVDDRIFDHP
jgi:hypothetical protein